MQPYDEPWIVNVASPEFWRLYQQANRVFGDDPEGMIWIARTQYDIDAGMSQQASLNKHLAECALDLGLAPPDPGVPPPGGGGGGQTLSKLTNDGRYFRNDGGSYFPAFASCLYGLADGRDPRPALDQLQQMGFGGVRVFAGHLEGRGQTAQSARQNLPRFMDETKARGLYAQVAAVTDSAADNYDVRQHVREIAQILEPYPHGLLCIANEYWHPTQRASVHDPNYLRRLGGEEVTPRGVLWAVGAAEIDELDVNSKEYPGYGGGFNQVHLQRRTSSNYPWWQEACRVKEQWDVAAKHRTPCMDGEPNKKLIGTPFYFTLGILDRGFNLGSVCHTEDGLQARPFGADMGQAEFFMRAKKLISHNKTYTFYNARWENSPVRTARFVEPAPGDPPGNTVWRCYSFTLPDNTGFVVASGPNPDAAGIEWGSGWKQVGFLDKVPNCNVIDIRRG